MRHTPSRDHRGTAAHAEITMIILRSRGFAAAFVALGFAMGGLSMPGGHAASSFGRRHRHTKCDFVLNPWFAARFRATNRPNRVIRGFVCGPFPRDALRKRFNHADSTPRIVRNAIFTLSCAHAVTRNAISSRIRDSWRKNAPRTARKRECGGSCDAITAKTSEKSPSATDDDHVCVFCGHASCAHPRYCGETHESAHSTVPSARFRSTVCAYVRIKPRHRNVRPQKTQGDAGVDAHAAIGARTCINVVDRRRAHARIRPRGTRRCAARGATRKQHATRKENGYD